MKITTETIKILRNQTQAGILSCKKALEKTSGNIEEAVLLLKKEGIIKATKNSSDKVAAEGLTNVAICGNKAILFELNTETDFVAKNKIFLNLYNKITELLLTSDELFSTVADFLKLRIKKQNVQNIILETAAVLKEKIVLSRLQVVTKNTQESFGFYKHQGGKISSLVVLSKDCPEVAMDLPIHIVGFNPKFISKDQADPQFIAKEKKFFLSKTLEEKTQQKSLSSNIIEKIVEQRLNKFLEEICLLEQPLYNNQDQTVSAYLDTYQIKIIAFYRFEVGKRF
ncbi:translation elongation factor Ts [Candidatus Phytoplasma phoenicium]|uniref:Elongation factor Ts n=1 Tax=Candidatus Phytoplasma phoenicium TaxID=198422 RepID=A0A0L0MIU3_9MOLU|nr:translation elongation factor Ts [Candidatus Phytoplasma phoenicium]KND62572.1 Elongation factor Ts [Candidatus Phytoplasma phoenicium]